MANRTPPTKHCQRCGREFPKPYTCGLPEWARRRFCSVPCANTAKRGKPAHNKGKRYPSKAQRVPCRICGLPTKYAGSATSVLIDKVHCGREECAAASRALKNRRIHKALIGREHVGATWGDVAIVSREERMLEPWFFALGWQVQYILNPATQARQYTLDFAQPELRLNVEVDGSSHRTAERKERDRLRDQRLGELGWRVLRIPAELVSQDPDRAKATVIGWLS